MSLSNTATNLCQYYDFNHERISSIKTLLYEYYINTLKWSIPPNNPSGLKIVKHKNKKILTDDYDSHATWFKVSNQDTVQAAIRLCHEDMSGLLELERYENASKKLKNLFLSKKYFNLVELNREAINHKIKDGILPCLLLLRTVLQYCIERDYSIITTTNLEWWVNIYEMVGFPRLPAYDFKYYDFEEKEVRVYFAEKSVLKYMLSNTLEIISNSENQEFYLPYSRYREQKIPYQL